MWKRHIFFSEISEKNWNVFCSHLSPVYGQCFLFFFLIKQFEVFPAQSLPRILNMQLISKQESPGSGTARLLVHMQDGHTHTHLYNLCQPLRAQPERTNTRKVTGKQMEVSGQTEQSRSAGALFGAAGQVLLAFNSIGFVRARACGWNRTHQCSRVIITT